jgi:hypothetical protein
VKANEMLDITPNNVLYRITGLKGLNEDKVLELLGSLVVNPVLNASHERYHRPIAPDHLIYLVN